ncbi:hypothetical protein ACP70R_010003 [Stipagrostis hirtigluma subsp. patula]
MSSFVSKTFAMCITMSSSSTQTFPSQAEQEADVEGETNPALYQHFDRHLGLLTAEHRKACPTRGSTVTNKVGRWRSVQTAVVGAMVADACFTARTTDIFIATAPKSGTTWMKTLLYATVHRREHPVGAADHPFNSLGPHECIMILELHLQHYYTTLHVRQDPRPPQAPGSKAAKEHRPFRQQDCVRVPRPKDVFVSTWSFTNKFRSAVAELRMALRES